MADFLTMNTNNFMFSISKVDFRNNTYAAKVINLMIQTVTNNTMFDVISSSILL